MNAQEIVIVRPAQLADKNFILATWLRGLFYGNSMFKEVRKDIFMTNYHKVVEHLLARPENIVKIACLKDDAKVILGYSVLNKEQTVAHWVFVKKAWRNIGIAKSLVPPTVTTVTHITGMGLSIIRKNPEVAFNPFLI